MHYAEQHLLRFIARFSSVFGHYKMTLHSLYTEINYLIIIAHFFYPRQYSWTIWTQFQGFSFKIDHFWSHRVSILYSILKLLHIYVQKILKFLTIFPYTYINLPYFFINFWSNFFTDSIIWAFYNLTWCPYGFWNAPLRHSPKMLPSSCIQNPFFTPSHILAVVMHC